MGQMDPHATGEPWLYPIALTTNSHTVIFNTENKFLDTNIKAEITVNAGTLNKPTINNTNLGTYFKDGTASSNSVSLRPQVTNTAGFIDVHTSSAPMLGDYAYYTIRTGEGQANTADVVLYTTDGSNAGTNISSIIKTADISTTEPNTSGVYYLAFTGSGSSKIKTAGWFTANTQLTAASTTKYFPVTAAAGTVTKKSGSVSPTASLTKSDTLSWGDSNTSGISVTAHGNATATFVAVANITTAGYAPKVNEKWTSGSQSIAAASSDATAIKYLTGVNIASGKSFSVTNAGTLTVTNNGTATVTNSGTITVTSSSTPAGTIKINAYPESGSTADAEQTIVSSGRWTTNKIGTTTNSVFATKYGKTIIYYGTADSSHAMSTNSFITTSGASSSSYDFSITPRHNISKAGYLAATTNPVNGTVAYYKIVRTSINQTHKTTVANNAATRAVADWTAGWLAAGSIGAATFAAAKDTNKAETDYVDISDTPSAPVLSSGGYLYINRGYVDDLKISLAKLVPDTITGKTMAPANYILTGYAAFNGAGQAINGTMAIYDGTYTVS